MNLDVPLSQVGSPFIDRLPSIKQKMLLLWQYLVAVALGIDKKSVNLPIYNFAFVQFRLMMTFKIAHSLQN